VANINWTESGPGFRNRLSEYNISKVLSLLVFGFSFCHNGNAFWLYPSLRWHYTEFTLTDGKSAKFCIGGSSSDM
jgi:hypothetical protein